MLFMTADKPSHYDFASPLDDREIESAMGIFPRLVGTRAFNRLKSISFLGGIDYLLVRNPNGAKGHRRYTRYQHSLGVARLAMYYGELRALDARNRGLICAAALLHDIGHAPLSHSLEPVFRRNFGQDHHHATKQVIRGDSPLGPEISIVLTENGYDPEEIIAVIDGEIAGYDYFFSGPINFDTVEGILRSQSYAKNKSSITSPEAVIEAAMFRRGDKDRDIVDSFWEFKDQTYRSVINSKSGVLADLVCQSMMAAHIDQFDADDYFITETQLFKRLPDLKRLLASPFFDDDARTLVGERVNHNVRRFVVNRTADFFARADTERYRQTKSQRTLALTIDGNLEGEEPSGGSSEDERD